jgi:Asp-tRNA(Asn)/Glu-tRNA(Gln) amidotransferase A subunit family amidase
VVEALLPLIQRDSKPPGKHAASWLASNVEEILATAKASSDRWAAGRPLGILDGVPIGIKSDIDLTGYITSVGMKVNTSHSFFKAATETAWPVEKLLEAGAIVVGQNNMHEAGMGKFC